MVFLNKLVSVWTVVAVLSLSQLATGCWLFKKPVSGEEVGKQAVFVEPGEPTIKPGLVLKVSVTASGQDAVAESVKEVNANGEILMPLIGAVKCDGLTLVALQEQVKKAYKDYFIEPQVTVSFVYQEGMKSPWGSVLVLGEVMRPGPVNMPSTRDLTVTRALMMSGNVTALADKKSVRVNRREQDGSLKQFTVDIELIGKEGRADMDVLLRPGDVVYVPESWY